MNKSVSILSEDSVFKGDLEENGDVRLEGAFIGTVNSKGKVTIGKNGKIEANIEAKDIEVGGKLVGNIKAKSSVKLNAGCSLEGDISVPVGNISIEEGTYFDGTCHMETPK
jgi:cytoskeletal protein CcmA (bactofilin family)